MIGAVGAIGGALIAGGAVVAVNGARRRPAPQRDRMPARSWRSELRGLLGLRNRTGVPATALQRRRNKVILTAAASVLAWLITGWLVSLFLVPAGVFGLPKVLKRKKGAPLIDRLEAMEEWTRSLAGVLGGAGKDLPTAIASTRNSAPALLKPEITRLITSLRDAKGLEAPLREFADDLNDSTGDKIAHTLIMSADLTGDGLAAVLEGLAKSVADEVKARRDIEAERSNARAVARWITAAVLASAALMDLLDTSWRERIGSPAGQVFLTVFSAIYVLLVLWVLRIDRGKPAPRFLNAASANTVKGA